MNAINKPKRATDAKRQKQNRELYLGQWEKRLLTSMPPTPLMDHLRFLYQGIPLPDDEKP